MTMTIGNEDASFFIHQAKFTNTLEVDENKKKKEKHLPTQKIENRQRNNGPFSTERGINLAGI